MVEEGERAYFEVKAAGSRGGFFVGAVVPDLSVDPAVLVSNHPSLLSMSSDCLCA